MAEEEADAPCVARVTLRPLRSEERAVLEVKIGTQISDLRCLIQQKFGVSPAAKILKFTKDRVYKECLGGEKVNRNRVFFLKGVEWLQDPGTSVKSQLLSRNPEAYDYC